MTDEAYDLSERAPTDEEGHPIHPERGHRICAATKSDRTTPTDHGRERDEYDYCLLPAGWGTDGTFGACQRHPYDGSQIGQQNPNFKHGKTSEYFKSKLSERQRDVYEEWVDALDDPEEAKNLLAMVASRLVLTGEASRDASLVREGRQMLSEFNIVENADEVAVEHSGGVETEHSLDDETRDIVRDVLAARRGEGDE